MPRRKVINPYHVGEVCQFVLQNCSHHKGKDLYWCIVKQVFDTSCHVAAWDGNYIMWIENLKSFSYSEEECLYMQSLHNRITKIIKNPDLEQSALSALKQLGEIGRPYLTELEEMFLIAIEKKYSSPLEV